MHSQLCTLQFETLNFAWLRTFYRHDRSWITSVGVKGGDRRPAREAVPAHTGTPSIDRHSGRWHTRNVAKQPGGRGLQRERDQGSAVADRSPDDVPGNCLASTLDAAVQSVDVAGGWAQKTAGSGWVSGAMAYLSKRRHGARRGGGCDRWPAGYGRPQTCHLMQPDDWPKSQCSFLFPIEADWSGYICTAGPMQWHN